MSDSAEESWLDDPQIVINGHLRHGKTADVVEFSLFFLKFEIRFTVTIPVEGTTIAPVYVRFRIARRRAA